MGEIDAEELLEEYSTGNYKHASYYIEKGDYAFKEDEFEDAIYQYTKAIKIEPRNCDLYLKRGNTKAKDNDFNGACEDWKKAAELGNEDAAKLMEEHCK